MSTESKPPIALSLELCREIFDCVDDGVFFVDLDRRITFWNRGAERLTGLKAADVVGRICGPDILGHIDENGESMCPVERCPLANTICTGAGTLVETNQLCLSGKRLQVYVSTLPLVDRSGTIIGGIETFTDLPERRLGAERMMKLEKAVFLDDLTGIANRHYFRTTLAARFAEALRHDVPFGLLIADLDHFKRVNDSHGHIVGDAVLCIVAETLASVCRPTDLVCRWGGEEFAVIVANTDLDGLRIVSERYREEVAAARYRNDSLEIGVTLSVGATLARRGDTSDSLIQRCDRLLYTAKESGRDCVVFDDAQGGIKPLDANASS